MVSFGQKVKCVKTCETHIYKHTRVVLWKNPLQKEIKYSRNETILKIGHLAKAMAKQSLEALQNGQFGSKIKMAKNMRKTVVQGD